MLVLRTTADPPAVRGAVEQLRDAAESQRGSLEFEVAPSADRGGGGNE